jgi:DNA-binding PadR family transcriptional regulator
VFSELHSGPPFGRGPAFGGGRGRRRRGDVRAALLLLLAEQPLNGYQLMQAIEERSGGRWRPSPGSIYPTLAQLEDQGLIKATERDGAKLFEVTEAGHRHLATRHEDVPPWIDESEPAAFGDLRAQLKQLHVAAIQVVHAGSGEQVAAAADAIAKAKRELYRILADDDG